jgi:hypothetical protein
VGRPGWGRLHARTGPSLYAWKLGLFPLCVYSFFGLEMALIRALPIQARVSLLGQPHEKLIKLGPQPTSPQILCLPPAP